MVDTVSFAEAVTMARGEPKMTCRVAQPREDAPHGPGSLAAARLVTTAAACFSLLSRRSSTHSAVRAGRLCPVRGTARRACLMDGYR